MIRRYGEAAQYLIKHCPEYRKMPWIVAYNNIQSRCRGYNKRDRAAYSSKGFKSELTPTMLKDLFMRDRAWEMDRPSIDRVDADKGYEKSNVRWVPMDINRRERGMKNPGRAKKYAEGKALILAWFEKQTPWDAALRSHFLRELIRDVVRGEHLEGRKIRTSHTD